MSNKVNTGRVGFCSLLTILFIGLKLTNVITLSWLWVVSPLWIPILSALVIGGMVLFLKKLVERHG